MVENSQQSSCASLGHFTRFCIGDVSVEAEAENYSDFVLAPVLGLFRADSKTLDIRLKIAWVNSLCDSKSTRLFDSGSTWRLYEWGTGFRFDFLAKPLNKRPYKSLTIDRDFRKGRLVMSREFFAEPGRDCLPLQYPLDELLIMHRLTQEKAIELHGCGIVRADGTGNLFVGHSGAGKSTTTRLWTEREDVEVLSDDRIIVRRDHKKQVPHRRCAPVRSDNEKRSGNPGRIRMYGTPWHGEAMYASPNSAPLARIFVLEHGHGNVITRLSASQAVAELFARAFVPFHRHEYVESALTFLEEVVEEIPVYRYAFEPNEMAVEVVAGFRD